jgi:hypothetical protein
MIASSREPEQASVMPDEERTEALAIILHHRIPNAWSFSERRMPCANLQHVGEHAYVGDPIEDPERRYAWLIIWADRCSQCFLALALDRLPHTQRFMQN